MGTPPRFIFMQILCGVVLGVIASEATIRTLMPDRNWTPSSALSGSAMRVNAAGYHQARPDLATGAFTGWFAPTPVFTDGNGFRVPGPETERPEVAADAERVLVLGASYTWGFGVAGEETWPYVLERLAAASDRPLRVANAAQPGYSAPQMFAILDSIPDDELPEHVFWTTPATGLYMLGLGDEAAEYPFENPNSSAYIIFPLMFSPRDFPAIEMVNGWYLLRDRPLRGAAGDFLRTRSAVGHRIVERWIDMVRPTRPVKRTEPLAGEMDRLRELTREVARSLRASAERCRRRGVKIHQLSIPASWKSIPDPWTAERIELATIFSLEAGLLAGVITPVAFTEGAWTVEIDNVHGGDLLHFDHHYSARGHEKLAARVLEWFMTTAR